MTRRCCLRICRAFSIFPSKRKLRRTPRKTPPATRLRSFCRQRQPAFRRAARCKVISPIDGRKGRIAQRMFGIQGCAVPFLGSADGRRRPVGRRLSGRPDADAFSSATEPPAALPDLKKYRALGLLGEPGMGKSTTLEAEAARVLAAPGEEARDVDPRRPSRLFE